MQPRLAEAHKKSTIQIKDDFAVVSIVKGMTFVLVELDSLEAMKLVSLPGQTLVVDDLDQGWDETFLAIYLFVRTKQSPEGAVTLQTRMMEGTLEDPATGSAASALTAYLSLSVGESSGTQSYELVQGVEMGRRSEILIGKCIGVNEMRSTRITYLHNVQTLRWPMPRLSKTCSSVSEAGTRM
jgi:predicted PhzF superfamily epimerase YddE/YHI9